MSKSFETTNTRTISKFDYDPNSSSSISNHMLFLEDSFFIFSYKNTVSVLAIIDSFLPVITSDNIFTFDFPSTLIQVRGDIGEKSIVVLHYDSSKNLSTFSTLLITNIIHRNSELESQIVIENKVNDFYVVSQRQYLIIDSNKKMSLMKDNETLFMFNDYVDMFLFDLKRQIISCVNNDKNNIVIWNDGLRGIFPKKWFDQTVDIEFEGAYFKAPKEFDKVLTHGYGNYMKLPSKKDRIPHHYYDAYRK